MAYITSYRNQNWLIPKSIRDMIPKNHICYLVEDFVYSLDFSKFDMIYEGAGHPAYHPSIIMKILLQGMLSKIRSSRKLANACIESFVFMYLAEKVKPNFRTIARFRKDNAGFIKDSFKKTVELASSHNLVDLSFIGIDGSTLKANAGNKRAVKKDALDILDKAVDRMIKEDIALDELEEQMYGDKEENLTNMDRRDMKRIVKDYFKQNKEEIKKMHDKLKKEFKKDPKQKKLSLTDPDCRMMQTKKAYSELSYNTQISVDSKAGIVVANDICQDGNDANQLIPQIKNIKGNIRLRKHTKIGADCAYSSGNNLKFCKDEEIDAYIPSRAQAQKFDGKEQTLNHDDYGYDWTKDEVIYKGKHFRYVGSYCRKNTNRKILIYKSKDGTKKDVPEFFRERLRMKEKMETKEGKQVYNLRKITAEPVIGNIKENLGFREFLLRGLEKVKIELNLVCIAHNLQKIWRISAAKSC